MTAAELTELGQIVERIKPWPAALRITLAKRILDGLLEAKPVSARGLTAEEVMARLPTVSPAPTDEECKQILLEELLKKHSP